MVGSVQISWLVCLSNVPAARSALRLSSQELWHCWKVAFVFRSLNLRVDCVQDTCTSNRAARGSIRCKFYMARTVNGQKLATWVCVPWMKSMVLVNRPYPVSSMLTSWGSRGGKLELTNKQTNKPTKELTKLTTNERTNDRTHERTCERTNELTHERTN